ncbi:MAG TPA: DUF4352 domain-containing protein, partial [Bacteroidales bacterium]|nr:DUF4352 domain-containing protein [Bacteroidales bacterium]
SLYGSPDLSDNNKETKPKKPFYKRWWFILLIIIVIIGVLGSGVEEDTPQKVSEEPIQSTSGIEEIEESVPEFFYPGDIVETNSIRAIITGIEKSTGSEFNKPADGNEFILINMTLENIADEELNISSMLSFNAYVDDTTINENLLAQIEADNTMDGTIASGKKLTGTLGYEVPQGWGQIEIHFEPDVWDDTTIKWIVENE